MKGAVFDLDGTLVDSAPDIASALTYALARQGMGPVDDHVVREVLGGGARMLVRTAISLVGGDLEATDIVLADFTVAYLSDPVSGTTVNTDAHEALRRLKTAGLRIGVCTNKRTDLAHRVLTGTGLAPFVDTVMGIDAVPAAKPDPAHLFAALSALGVDARDAVYVGDAAVDEQTARAAGVRYRHVAWGRAIAGRHTVIADFGSLATELTEELWLRETDATEH